MKTNSITKVAKDMYIEQMKWTVWFIGIIMAVYIALTIVSNYYNYTFINNLLMFTAGSTMIYMFVIGIIAGASFLPLFIKLGVTRKICVYGMVVAALCLSITLPILFILFALIESLFIGMFEFNFTFLIIYVFNIFVAYLLGWLINIGFNKFNWIIGLVFIGFSVFLNFLYALIWKNNFFSLNEVDILDNNLEAVVQFSGSSFMISSVEALCLTFIIILIIRLLTKNMPIKIK
jgi:hypothetical protein